ncbi:hypothetical protein [Neobacillus novalis]|uniref:hypothetical protein n=2 Tax=Neobacillus novalis TaxID=220687 RepID=UPI001C59C43B|nr:hypothetical protein [Neobacillus novalis]
MAEKIYIVYLMSKCKAQSATAISKSQGDIEVPRGGCLYGSRRSRSEKSRSSDFLQGYQNASLKRGKWEVITIKEHVLELHVLRECTYKKVE